MKTQFKLWAVMLVALTSLCSCDYWGDYFYTVENQLDDKDVTFQFSSVYFTTSDTHGNGEAMSEPTLVLKPHEKKTVLRTLTDVMGKHEHPEDIMLYRNDLGHFEVSIDGKRINLPLWDREYWTFSTKELRGDYHLVINEELLQSVNQ